MKKLMFLLVFCALGISAAWAQKTFSGKVLGPDGLGLPGVSVIEKGNSVNGVATDIDGNWTLTVPNGDAILQFSSIGMKTIEVAAKEAKNLKMKDDSQMLDEVVVTGYGTTTKQSFTGTAARVDAEKLEAKNSGDISKALQGEAAGVQVINTSGQPGTSATVRIRGIGSVNGNRNPLYIVDGIPYNGSIASLNPSDIESTTILKDASATAIYGSRGANGVIVITTKKGKSGKSQIEVDVKYGVNMSIIPRYETISSPEQYTEMSWNAFYNRGVAEGEADPAAYANATLFSDSGIDPKYNLWDADGADLIDPTTGKFNSGVSRRYNPEDWEDEAFQNSRRVEANVKLSGGSEKTSYYTSFGFLDDIGYSVNSDFRRYTGRMNVKHDIREWLKGSMEMGYAYSEMNANGQSSDSGSIFWFVDNIPSIYPLYLRDSDGNKVEDPYYGGYEYDYGQGRGFGALTNAIADAHYNMDRTLRHNLDGNAYLEASFLKHFKLSSRFGLGYYNASYDALNNPFYGSSAQQNGSIYKAKTEMFSYTWTKMLRYTNEFGEHNLDAFLAHENTSWERKRMTGYKSNLADPTNEELNNGVVSSPSSSYTLDYTLESYFAQANYNYAEKYFASLTVRRDGSSRFKKDKWGTFGAIGAGWMISKEAFMDSADWVKELKLKASYGLIGEQGGVGLYPGEDLYSVNNLDDEISLIFESKGNPDLTWETSKMFQVGVEYNLWDRVEGSFDYYVKTTDDLLFNRRVGPSIGYALITVNDGRLRNTGFEFDITGHIVKTNDFTLDLTVNGEIPKNEMLEMPIDPSTGMEKVIDIASPYGRSVGHSLYDFYMREYAGVDPTTGLSTWNQYYDDKNDNDELDDGEEISSMVTYLDENENANVKKTTTTTYADATQKYVGKKAIPTVRGAFRLEASYKGFDLSTQFLYRLGGYAVDYTYRSLMGNDAGGNNWHVDMLDRWQEEGDITDVPRLDAEYSSNVNSTSTRFLTKADYLYLNNVRLGYNFAEKVVKRAGLQAVQVWVSGDNLMQLTKRKGFNPAASETGATSTYTYTPLSTITAGIKVQF